MARLRPSWYAGTTLTLLAVAAACSDPLEPADLAGNYVATRFTVQVPGASAVDALAIGASVQVELKADGTTTGRLVLPAIPGFSTLPADESLDGTFRVVSGDKVRLTQQAQTFVSDLIFVAEGRELRATYSFFDSQARPGAVMLTLTRQ
jgi:hypothetical protein